MHGKHTAGILELTNFSGRNNRFSPYNFPGVSPLQKTAPKLTELLEIT